MFFKQDVTRRALIENLQSKSDAVLSLAVWLVFIVFVILSLRYQYLLLGYKRFEDEAETIVVAKMMAAGMKLYSEIFNHHGPLTFLPGVILEKIGDYGIKGHRVLIALLQILAIFSIYKMPILKSTTQKIIASAVSSTLIIVFMPDMFGHEYLYQTLAGILLVVILSQYTIIAIFCPEASNRFRVVLGNILIISLPFLAIIYLPIAASLFLASLRKQYLKRALIGCLAGLLANLLFLGFYGSFSGFLAFHLYLNGKILPLYFGPQPGSELIFYATIFPTTDLVNFLSFFVLLLSSSMLASKEKSFPWRTLLLLVGLCSLHVRGCAPNSYRCMPYFYAILPLFAFILGILDEGYQTSKFVAIGFLSLLILKVSLLLPGEKQRLLSDQIQNETEFSRLVQKFTTKSDRIIAYTFLPYEYLVSKRLPASGNFFYLPWQEKYNENPKFGVRIDACKQIKESAPKVMFIDKWTVGDRYSWDSYATCIQNIIDSDYQQVPDKPYYLRKDLVKGFESFFAASKNRKRVPSPVLSTAQPIYLKSFQDITRPSKDRQLIGLDIMFGTGMRINPGIARLILKRTDGSILAIDFSLPELQDNLYKHFDLPAGIYTVDKIVSLHGGGIIAWESHDEHDKALTCLTFTFADGDHSFTPGCPMA